LAAGVSSVEISLEWLPSPSLLALPIWLSDRLTPNLVLRSAIYRAAVGAWLRFLRGVLLADRDSPVILEGWGDGEHRLTWKPPTVDAANAVQPLLTLH